MCFNVFSDILQEFCDRENFSEVSDLEGFSDDDADPTFVPPPPRIPDGPDDPDESSDEEVVPEESSDEEEDEVPRPPPRPARGRDIRQRMPRPRRTSPPVTAAARGDPGGAWSVEQQTSHTNIECIWS